VTEIVLKTEGLSKSFGGLRAVDDVDFELPAGGLHAIIGPNGAGKTTFFNLITGLLAPDSGRVSFFGRDITGMKPHRINRLGLARTLQIKSVFDGLSVYDNVWVAAHSHLGFLHPLRPVTSYRATASKVEVLLDRLGLQGCRDELAGNLSYGDVALLEIAIALATEPKLLLLDEPVAGMSPTETRNTVQLVKELSKSVNIILIEHDMEVVFDAADVITVMNQGAILCRGTPAQIAKDKRVQEAYLGVSEEARC
jgi:branched-chain amino acid transport system ATP-binding protein